uniref:Glycosyltransferase family 2 protein n=1 Tax=Ignavibacterium album TaxID=591197 RepID=A0A7V3E6N5_9BACT
MVDISVIIPVFNAEQFLRKSVQSVLQFEFIKEIILVDDYSTDNSLVICEELSRKYNKIKVYRHPAGHNKGASAARNFGIKMAKSEYLAFLDADDIYLPNRFGAEYNLLPNEYIDAVYGALGIHYHTENGLKNFRKMKKKELTTLAKYVAPQELKYVLVNMHTEFGGNNYFTLDTLTIKKSLVLAVGGFNENLRVGEDNEFNIKISIKGRLIPGIIDKPIALRGVHDNNTLLTRKPDPKHFVWSELEIWLQTNVENEEKLKYWISKEKDLSLFIIENERKSFLRKVRNMKSLILKHPVIFFNYTDFRRIVIKTLGKGLIIKSLLRIKELIINIFFKDVLTKQFNNYYFTRSEKQLPPNSKLISN